MSTHQLLYNDLNLHVEGDVLTDHASLGIYSTDASLYQITPVAVVLPKNESDVLHVINIARDHNISILPRGGGTGLAGQTVGRSIIMDFSKYMNRIIEFNEEDRWVRVQPGLVRDELNEYLKEFQLHFAPDPATSSRANIGGMIGNNSSGTKSILYGKTVDHILEMKVALADGAVLNFQSHGQKEYSRIAQQDDREGNIYKKFQKIIHDNRSEIQKKFPKVMRRVQGYNLDEFADRETWNLSKLICGSEGTLATILEARLNLEPLPKYKSVCVVHFHEMNEAIKAVRHMLDFNPSAVEILDDTVLQMSRENLTTKRHTHFIEGDPKAVQIVEFYGDHEQDVLDRPARMAEYLKSLNLGYAYPVFREGQSYEDVWIIRKKGLGLMLGMKGDKKPLAFIEDASIPIDVLPEYIEKVVAVCDRHQTRAAVYAHASVGVIHVRPILDMRQAEDIERFKNIARETFELVKHFGGSWSGEHGDGLVRSYFLPDYFGPEVYEALVEVKNLFDPQNLMNPGKIIDAPEIDEDLRYGAAYRDSDFDTLYHYREDGSFQNAVHMCSGVGECRKILGGTMCPSFKATRDEEHSTRGRANALRLAMSGQLDKDGLTSHRLKEVLDLCLSCKACKSECPSNVDMAKLKSEVLQKHYDKYGLNTRDRLIGQSSTMARLFAGRFAAIINFFMNTNLSRWLIQYLAGIDKRRKMPEYASNTFTRWYDKNYKRTDSREGPNVVLFADTYLNYHEPQIGIQATRLLSKLGYEIRIADVGCCQRPRISHGLLQDARKEGDIVLNKIDQFTGKGMKVLVCEPSCYTALIDDLCDLTANEALAKRIQEHVLPLDKFVADHIRNDGLPVDLKIKSEQFVIHGHCHQKAFTGTGDLHFILNSINGVQVKEIPSGCCGMAGAFGYEQEHYDLSKKIAHEILVPEIEKMNGSQMLIANGFSCRHQIQDFTSKKSVHWTEIFELD